MLGQIDSLSLLRMCKVLLRQFVSILYHPMAAKVYICSTGDSVILINCSVYQSTISEVNLRRKKQQLTSLYLITS